MTSTALKFAALALGSAALLTACGKPAADATAPAAPPAAAPGAPAVAGDWASLSSAVGKTPSQSGLLENSAISADLRSLVTSRIDALKANLQVGTPLQRDAATGVLYTTGTSQNGAGMNQAYILIDPATRALEVGLWEGGELSIYKTMGSNIAKPPAVQTMLTNTPG